MPANPLQEVFNAYDDGSLLRQTDEQLRRSHNICVNCQGSDLHSRTKASHVATRIEQLLSSNQEIARHKEVLNETGKLRQEIVEEQKVLKSSLEQLGHPRLIDWAILIVGVIAAVASIIGYWPQIVAVFRALVHVF